MKRSALAAIVAVMAVSPPATASDVTNKKFKGWAVQSKSDLFSENSRSVIALNMAPDGSSWALRCLISRRSIALREARPRFQVGQVVDVKLRADKGTIIVSRGKAVTDTTVALDDDPKQFETLRGAKQVAFRLEWNGITVDRLFAAGDVNRAIEEIEGACPLTNAPGQPDNSRTK